LTGKVPFEAPDIQEAAFAHVNTALTPPNHLNPAITAPTNEAICMAMAKDPAQRYQTYDDFIMALESARSHLLVQKYRSES
jgi:serine/threonine-protein kinase